MNEDEALRCLDIANAAIRVSDWSKVHCHHFWKLKWYRLRDLLKRVWDSRTRHRRTLCLDYWKPNNNNKGQTRLRVLHLIQPQTLPATRQDRKCPNSLQHLQPTPKKKYDWQLIKKSFPLVVRALPADIDEEMLLRDFGIDKEQQSSGGGYQESI